MSQDKPPSSNDKNSWWQRFKTTFSKTPQDRTALIEVLRDSEARNILDPDVLMMLEGALHVAEIQVREIMVPRVQMVVVRHLADADPNRALLGPARHLRSPWLRRGYLQGRPPPFRKWCAEPSVHGGKKRPKDTNLVV